MSQINTEPTVESAIPLAPDHKGLRIDFSGMLHRAQRGLNKGQKDAFTAELLRQLSNHLSELGRRWYAGDATVVDEFLQLYCIAEAERGQRSRDRC